MQYSMRRKEKAMSEEDCIKLMKEAEYGVLSLCGADMEPYGVPLNYALDGRALYFHGALEGRKADLMRENPRAAFCVVSNVALMRESFNTKFQSVMAFGRLEILETQEQRHKALMLLTEKLVDAAEEAVEKYFAQYMPKALVFKLNIEELSGKQKL